MAVLLRRVLVAVILISVIQFASSKEVDWEKYLPSTCFHDLNYTLPKSVIDLNISIGINAIYEISEEKMEFGMQIVLYEFWSDPYLKVPVTDDNFNGSTVLIPPKIIDCIWKPDTIFQNAKEEKLYDKTSPNVFYKLQFNERGYASVFRKSRYKLTVACHMEFEFYPMDNQSCFLQIALFHSRKHQVRLRWDEKNLRKKALKVDETPLNFAVRTLPSTHSEFQYPGVSVVMEYLNANFMFKRSLSASLFNTYIPSFLVVSLSMVSFWLDIDAVPGRVTLGVTSILTLSTQIVQARSGLPVLDYMTAMDVWLLGCLLMVFLSLVEFIFANSIARQKRSVKIRNSKDVATNLNDKNPPASPLCFKCRSTVESNITVKQTTSHKSMKDNYLDRLSRIAFPILMLIFTFVYWFYYYR